MTDVCYCGQRATVAVPGWRCTQHICADCHQREQHGPRLHAERRARADRETRERIAARLPWLLRFWSNRRTHTAAA